MEEEPVKRNCWTCRHNDKDGACTEVNAGNKAVMRWLDEYPLARRDGVLDMPPKDADGCPGYKVNHFRTSVVLAGTTTANPEPAAAPLDWITLARRYDLPVAEVPDRPWWRRYYPSAPGGLGVYIAPFWLRRDGCNGGLLERDPDGANLAAVDREHPYPAPACAAGQVWAWPDSVEVIVVGRATGRWEPNVAGDRLNGPWPPPGAWLVAGPHAPWAPTSAPTPGEGA